MSEQSPPNVEDGALVARARAGDRLAFEELVRVYADRLHAVVRRLVDNQPLSDAAMRMAPSVGPTHGVQDSPSVVGALLDQRRDGYCRIAPAGGIKLEKKGS